MSYPQQPGQYPQQPGPYQQQPGAYQPPQPGPYPQQPGPYPQMPPYPYPYPAYQGSNDPMRQPSKGTAVAAGVLAILGTLWALIFAIANFAATAELSTTAYAGLEWLGWTQASAYLIEVVTLGPGAILLFLRNDIGRWLVVGGTVVHILQGLLGGITVLAYSDRAVPSAEISGGAVGAFVVLSPAIATIILALLPPTTRWLRWNRAPQPVPPQQPMPPQQW